MTTYLTSREAAERAGIGYRMVREACASGELPCKRDRTAYLIAVEDVDAYRERLIARGFKPRAAARRRNRAAREAAGD